MPVRPAQPSPPMVAPCGVVWLWVASPLPVVWCGGVVWCGVVWCGVVWCGVVWCGVVWCGVVWCGVVWCGVVWCGVVWCGVVWVWCGVVWCGVVWCGVVWCGSGLGLLGVVAPSPPRDVMWVWVCLWWVNPACLEAGQGDKGGIPGGGRGGRGGGGGEPRTGITCVKIYIYIYIYIYILIYIQKIYKNMYLL